jgi:hypothetical protein
MDWRQVQFTLCVVAMVVIELNDDVLLFPVATAVALINFISSRLLCVFGQVCTLDSGGSLNKSTLVLFQINRISGTIGIGLFAYALFVFVS